MRAKLATAAIVAALFANAVAAEPGRAAEELLDLARATSPTLRAAQLEAAAAQARIQPAGALPDPMLKVELMDLNNGGTSSPRLLPGQVGSTQYTLSQQFPLWGKRQLRREIAEADALAARHGVETSWLDLAAEIKRAFAQYWLSAKIEGLTRELGDLMARLEKVARQRYAQGLAAQQDVIRAQLELTAVQQQLAQLQSEQRGLRAMLNALSGRAPDAGLAEPELLREIPSPAELQIDTLIERLRTGNPQLASEAARIAGAEKNRELSQRNRYPDLNLGLSPVQTGSRVGQWQLMFEINLPLQRETRRNQEREAGLMLDAARERRESMVQRLAGELSGSVAAIEAARRAEALTTASMIPQAQATFEAALAGYENGRVDFATLLDAQRAIRQAKIDRLRARAEQQIRLADIERTTGEGR